MEGGGSSGSGGSIKQNNDAQMDGAGDVLQKVKLQGNRRPGKEPAEASLPVEHRMVLHGANQQDEHDDEDEYAFEEDVEAIDSDAEALVISGPLWKGLLYQIHVR